jgi:hydrogenase nickel incorporation protein HypA/HybF
VTAVAFRAGRLRQVVPDALAFAFEICARETVVEGARLDQEVVPARLRCDTCDAEWEIELPVFRCPTCGTGDVAVLSGDELEVETIEVAGEEAPCIA